MDLGTGSSQAFAGGIQTVGSIIKLVSRKRPKSNWLAESHVVRPRELTRN